MNFRNFESDYLKISSWRKISMSVHSAKGSVNGSDVIHQSGIQSPIINLLSGNQFKIRIIITVLHFVREHCFYIVDDGDYRFR